MQLFGRKGQTNVCKTERLYSASSRSVLTTYNPTNETPESEMERLQDITDQTWMR